MSYCTAIWLYKFSWRPNLFLKTGKLRQLPHAKFATFFFSNIRLEQISIRTGTKNKRLKLSFLQLPFFLQLPPRKGSICGHNIFPTLYQASSPTTSHHGSSPSVSWKGFIYSTHPYIRALQLSASREKRPPVKYKYIKPKFGPAPLRLSLSVSNPGFSKIPEKQSKILSSISISQHIWNFF